MEKQKPKSVNKVTFKIILASDPK